MRICLEIEAYQGVYTSTNPVGSFIMSTFIGCLKRRYKKEKNKIGEKKEKKNAFHADASILS